MPEWDSYKITIPRSDERGLEGSVFDAVLHIAHLKEARRILEDGRLRAGLVNDGSRLDKSRTCVTFFSANTWTHGSIYGNVQWRYRWNELIEGKNIYWVEEKTGQTFPVYRFLISSRPKEKFPDLTPYDPKNDQGPLRQHDGIWYFKSVGCVSEFLFDGDLSLDDCQEFEFVDHNSIGCKNNDCGDKGLAARDAMAQTMAFVFGCNIHSLDSILQRPGRSRQDKRLYDVVGDGLGQAFVRLTTPSQIRRAAGIKDPHAATDVVRGVLALFGTGQIKRARALAWHLKSDEVLQLAIENIVQEHFAIDGWSLLEE